MPIKRLLETTSTPLPANGTYTTAWYSTDEFNLVTVHVLADTAGTAYLEMSEDGSTAMAGRQVSVAANTWVALAENLSLKFVRGRYVNGATAQTNFRLTLSALNTVI